RGVPARARGRSRRGPLVVWRAGRRRAGRVEARAAAGGGGRMSEPGGGRVSRAGGARAGPRGPLGRGAARRGAGSLVPLGGAVRPPRHAVRRDGRRPPRARGLTARVVAVVATHGWVRRSRPWERHPA